MSKSLKTIQVFAKIGKVISDIVFVFSIIFASVCLISFLLLQMDELFLKMSNFSINSIVAENSEMSIGNVYSTLVTGFIIATGEAVLSKFSKIYFKNELLAGTPFTFDGAKELLRLGILAVCIPVGTNVITTSINKLMQTLMTDIENFESDIGITVVIGIMFIVMSFVFRYGAEIDKTE